MCISQLLIKGATGTKRNLFQGIWDLGSSAIMALGFRKLCSNKVGLYGPLRAEPSALTFYRLAMDAGSDGYLVHLPPPNSPAGSCICRVRRVPCV